MFNNYKQKGEGEVVLLLHGLFGCLNNLTLLSNSLSDCFKVISIDLANHGDSKHNGMISHSSMTEDVLAIVAHLGIDEFSIVGHSLGGKVAMMIALKHPDKVNRLVVADIAPVAYPDLHLSVFEALSSIDLKKVTGKDQVSIFLKESGLDPKICSFLLQSLIQDAGNYMWRFDLNGLASSYQDLMGWVKSSHQYMGKALFVKGEKSNYVSSDKEPCIYEQFPKARIKTINHAGHWLHVERPKEFGGIVRDFLLPK